MQRKEEEEEQEVRRKRKIKKKVMRKKTKKKTTTKTKKKKTGSHSLSTNSRSVRNTIFKSPKPLEIVTCCLHKSYKMKPCGDVVSVHPYVYFISVTTQ